MLICVTAPKKGTGQTVTAINIAARMTQYIHGNVLLIDTNKFSKDIEQYLSDNEVTKGMDCLISLSQSGLLTEESFKTCTKCITPQIDILISNECFELTERHIETVLYRAKENYEVIIVDTIAGNGETTKIFLDKSDIIFTLINQQKNVCNLANENKLYKSLKNKIVVIVNMYRDGLNNKIHDIKNSLKIGIHNTDIFQMDYDENMINECNDSSILNYVLNTRQTKGEAHEQLDEIILHAMKKTGQKNLMKKEEKKQNLFSKLFGKGG